MASSEGFLKRKLLLCISALAVGRTCRFSFTCILWILPLLLGFSMFSSQFICHIPGPSAWRGHCPYVPAHTDSRFPCNRCTRSLSFRLLSRCSVVQLSASVSFCCTKRSGRIFSWISGMRSSKKLLGGEPRKNHLGSTGWRGSDLQNFSRHVKRFWAKMSGRKENSTFKMAMKWEIQRKKKQIFLLHCVKGLYAEDITSWMHIRSHRRSLSSINLILEPMITSVGYLNKATKR